MRTDALSPTIGAMLTRPSRLVLLALALCWLPASDAAGQAEWQRTVKVIAPVENGQVTSALTDSIVAMVEAQDVPLRRSPEANTATTLETIRTALSDDGLALSSATHAFLTYRFALRNSKLQRSILDLHLIYRPTAQQGSDIPILYVDLSDEQFYEPLLIEKGVPSTENEAVYHPFKEEIAFHGLLGTATVVKVGNRIIRDPEQAAAEERQIIATIRKLAYN